MKKLKILLLIDTLELGGAQTHLITLYNSLTEAGQNVYVVSNGGILSKNIRHKKINLVSHSPITLLKSFCALLSFIKREKFDILHAHARICALFAHLISKFCSIPVVCTAHARFKVGFLRKKLSFWGDKTIAVSEDLRLYLTKNYHIFPDNISVIENGLNTSLFSPSQNENPYHILFLSRLDFDCSLCAKALCNIAPSLYERYPKLQITIGGGGNDFMGVLTLANRSNRLIGEKILRLVGDITDVPAFLSSGGVFIGVSRAALEATVCEIPVILGGNEGFFGHLTTQNYDSAKATNFCARTSPPLEESLLFSSLCSVLDNYSLALSESKKLRKKVISELDSKALLPRTEAIYTLAQSSHASKKEKNPKTLLFGYYGYSNLGDDALLFASILRAKQEFGSSIGAFTHKPKKSKQDFCIPCFSRKNPFSLIFRLSRCDRLIFGGGTLLQNVTSTRSLLFYIAILRIGIFLKKDTLLFANGLGDIKQEKLKRLLLSTLLSCSYIGLRDRFSYDFFKSNFPYSKNVFLESDLALSLSPSTSSRAIFLVSSTLKDRSDRFFIVAAHSNATFLERFALEKEIKALKLLGLFPLFIISSPSDIYLSYKLKRKFGGAILQNITFSDLLAIIPLSKLTISMRYHPLLASRSLSSPFIAIGSDPKLWEFSS